MEVDAQQNQRLADLCRQFGIKLLLLHGSYASGHIHSRSDLDIAFLPEKNSKISLFELISHLQDIFPDALVDPVNLHHADPLLLNEVANNSLLLFGAEADYLAFQLHAFHRYNDYKPYFKREKEAVQQYLQSIEV